MMKLPFFFSKISSGAICDDCVIVMGVTSSICNDGVFVMILMSGLALKINKEIIYIISYTISL